MREMDLIRSNNLIDMRAIQISYLNEMRVIVLFLLFLPLSLFAQKISPLDYGLAQAKTGIERYRILLTTHYLEQGEKIVNDYPDTVHLADVYEGYIPANPENHCLH